MDKQQILTRISALALGGAVLAMPTLYAQGNWSGNDPIGASNQMGQNQNELGVFRVSNLIGARVLDQNGDRIGEIDDLLISANAQAPIYAVVSSDDWFDDTKSLVPVTELQPATEEAGVDAEWIWGVEDLSFTLPVEEDSFEDRAGIDFDEDDLAGAIQQSFDALSDFFGFDETDLNVGGSNYRLASELADAAASGTGVSEVEDIFISLEPRQGAEFIIRSEDGGLLRVPASEIRINRNNEFALANEANREQYAWRDDQQQRSEQQRPIGAAAQSVQQDQLFQLDDVLGARVIDTNGDRIGEIDDIIISADDRQNAFAIISGDDWFDDQKSIVPVSSLSQVTGEAADDGFWSWATDGAAFRLDVEEDRFEELADIDFDDTDLSGSISEAANAFGDLFDFGVDQADIQGGQFYLASELQDAEFAEVGAGISDVDYILLDLQSQGRTQFVFTSQQGDQYQIPASDVRVGQNNQIALGSNQQLEDYTMSERDREGFQRDQQASAKQEWDQDRQQNRQQQQGLAQQDQMIFRLDNVLGASVIDNEGDSIGEIDNLIVGSDNQASTFAVISTDDWFDDAKGIVPVSALSLSSDIPSSDGEWLLGLEDLEFRLDVQEERFDEMADVEISDNDLSGAINYAIDSMRDLFGFDSDQLDLQNTRFTYASELEEADVSGLASGIFQVEYVALDLSNQGQMVVGLSNDEGQSYHVPASELDIGQIRRVSLESDSSLDRYTISESERLDNRGDASARMEWNQEN